jgi:hypothetical protein
VAELKLRYPAVFDGDPASLPSTTRRRSKVNTLGAEGPSFLRGNRGLQPRPEMGRPHASTSRQRSTVAQTSKGHFCKICRKAIAQPERVNILNRYINSLLFQYVGLGNPETAAHFEPP